MTFPCCSCGRISPDNVLCLGCNSVYHCAGCEASQNRDCHACPPLSADILAKNDRRDILNYSKEYGSFFPEDTAGVQILRNHYELSNSYRVLRDCLEFEELEPDLEGKSAFDLRWGKDFLTDVESGETMAAHQEGRLKIGQVFKTRRMFFKKQNDIGTYPSPRVNYRLGGSYVAFGLTDLLLLLFGRYTLKLHENHSEGDSVHFLGVPRDAKSYVKCRVLVEMLKDEGCNSRSLLQFWFSTVLDRETHDAVMATKDRLLAESNVHKEVKKLLLKLCNIEKNPMTVKKAVQRWRCAKMPEADLNLLNVLRAKDDRIAYAKYLLTGCIFVEESSAFCANPALTASRRYVPDNIFRCLDVSALKEYKDSLFECAEANLRDKVNALRTVIQRGLLNVELCYQSSLPSIRRDDVLARKVKENRPVLIDWSDAPDLLGPLNFARYAELCGVESTIHVFHSSLWRKYVVGASIMDYMNNAEGHDVQEMFQAAKNWGDLRRNPRTMNGNEECKRRFRIERPGGVRLFALDTAEAALAPYFWNVYLRHFFGGTGDSNLVAVNCGPPTANTAITICEEGLITDASSGFCGALVHKELITGSGGGMKDSLMKCLLGEIVGNVRKN